MDKLKHQLEAIKTIPEYQESKLKAYWTTDCQGKKDYDTDILSFSCRMYPPRYGNHKFHAICELTLRNGQGSGFFEEMKNERREFICGNYFDLLKADFEGDTEQECKQKVEEWCNRVYNQTIRILTTLTSKLILTDITEHTECYRKIEWQ